jgi:hypothetical protein
VGRRDDLDVEAIGVVPPVVEGCGGEHGDAAPGDEESTEGGAEAEDPDGAGAIGRADVEGVGETRARAIRENLSRVAEASLLERYV